MASYDLNTYALPTIDFVGGSTQTLVFNLYNQSDHAPFNLQGFQANFSVCSYTDRYEDPLITKSMVIDSGSSHQRNVVKVTLDASDTLNLEGKFIYQVTMKNTSNREIDIPSQGIMHIVNNINKSYVGD